MKWDVLFDQLDVTNQRGCTAGERGLAQLLGIRLLKRCLSLKIGLGNVVELLQWAGIDIDSLDQFTVKVEVVRRLCNEWWASLPRKQGDIDAPLVKISSQITQFLGLSEVERDILILSWLLLRHPPLNDLYESITVVDYAQHISIVAGTLGHDPSSVATAMKPGSRLYLFGLIESPTRTFNRSDVLTAGALLYQLSPLLFASNERALSDDVLKSALLDLVPRQPAAHWPIASFTHVPQRQLVLDYFDRACIERRKGANVLIHGSPGIGKTELAKTIAGTLDVPLYGVPATDREGQSIDPKLRLGRYQIAQKLISGMGSGLLLFDEIEDILAGGAILAKGWTNHLLESNAIPALWVTNSVEWIDAAYLRRFDLIIEIAANVEGHYPNIEKTLAGVPILPKTRALLAKQPWMTPALASQLTDTAQLFRSRSPIRVERHLQSILSQRLRAQGEDTAGLSKVFGQAADTTRKEVMPAYRLEWISTNPGIDGLLQSIRRRGTARLCLYGPPGCGKTALAAHIAKSLDRPLMTVPASTLLDRYVGGTEKRIAEVFRQAHSQGAVLLIDELDSFLMCRNSANQHWEVTQTNEMLVQLESFQGVMIGTTNRFESLDRAVMRRFDLRVAFDYLDSTRLRSLLEAVLPSREREKLCSLSDAELNRFQVTPGNVATALSQIDLLERPLGLATLLPVLSKEEAAQRGEDSRNPIGFVM